MTMLVRVTSLGTAGRKIKWRCCGLLCKPGHVSSGLYWRVYLVSRMVIPRPWHVIHVISATNIARSILTVMQDNNDDTRPCNYIHADLDHMQWCYVTMLPWLAHTVLQCHMPCNNQEHYTCLALKSLLIATSNFLTKPAFISGASQLL